jgi:hypothetical protein
MLENANDPAKSKKGKQNRLRALSAAQVLDPNKFPYLFSPQWKWTILSALGRIKDQALRRGCAVIICESRMKTVEAVALAQMALYPKKTADLSRLFVAIQKTIERYYTRYPGQISAADVCKVLGEAKRFYSLKQ